MKSGSRQWQWQCAASKLLLATATAYCLLLNGCVSYVPVAGGDNFAYLYGKGAAAVRLQARVYHSSDSRSTIWFKLRTQDLLYKSSGGGGPFRAKVLLKYEAYPTIGSALFPGQAMLTFHWHL